MPNSSPPRPQGKRYYESSDSDEETRKQQDQTEYLPSKPRLDYAMPSIISRMKKRPKTNSSSKPIAPKMVQTRLALSDDLKTTCKDCGMSYMPTYAVDVKLHEKFHSQSLEGRDWSPEWGVPVTKSSEAGTFMDGFYIVKITHSSKLAEKRAAQDLITLVNTELSAPPENPTWKSGPAGAGAAYLYICSKKRKAIAVLVVERVTRGRPMLVPTAELLQSVPKSSGISFDRFPVIMGVSRIFTVRNYRRQGIGSILLSTACTDFIYGLKIQKNQVAWSQPSASGAKLALSWSPFSYSIGQEDHLPSPPPSSPPSSTRYDEPCEKSSSSSPPQLILTYLERDAVFRSAPSS